MLLITNLCQHQQQRQVYCDKKISNALLTIIDHQLLLYDIKGHTLGGMSGLSLSMRLLSGALEYRILGLR